jgi:hypothetical protein
MPLQTRDINNRVANTVQTIVFSEYLVVQSIMIYNIFLAIFAITDQPNMGYYFGIIAFSMAQYACNGINYRLNKEEHRTLVTLLILFFSAVTIGEIVLISYMIQTMPLMQVLTKVIFCLILIKDSTSFLIGIIGNELLKRMYARCESAREYHKDAMRRLGHHGPPEYNYKLTTEEFN